MTNFYNSIEFDGARPVDVSHIHGLPFPLSQDQMRIYTKFSPVNGAPWISSYTGDNFAAKFLDDFIKDQIAAK